jgi:hypothetical protein
MSPSDKVMMAVFVLFMIGIVLGSLAKKGMKKRRARRDD